MYKKVKFLNIIIFSLLLFGLSYCASENDKSIVDRIAELDKSGQLIVQIAELKIDSLQLEPYLDLLKEGIQTSVDREPGVLTLYAMSDKADPSKITVMEIYLDEASYNSHIASSHFQKYKTGTINMVDSLKLTQVKPIVFAAKAK